jgi:NTP pyrophosphatase (non-canonical NTP hydrolase)
MSQLTLAELEARVDQFVEARQWRPFHNPKNLAMSIAIETAELMEHFQWLTIEQSHEICREPEKKKAIAAELADVLIYALSFAQTAGIDPTEAILAKMARNEERFPAKVVGGKLGTKAGGGHLSEQLP